MATLESQSDQQITQPEKVDYDAKLKEIKDTFSGGLTENEKTKINGTLNDTFRTGLTEYMNDPNNATTLTEFKTSLSEFLNDYSGEDKENDDAYKSLVALAGIVGLNQNGEGKWVVVATVDTKPETGTDTDPKPEFKLEGLEGEDQMESVTEETKSVSKYVVSKRPSDEEEKKVDENLKLYARIEEIGRQGGLLDRVEKLLENDQLKENEQLKNTQNLLRSVKKILENPTKQNVNKLQKYIYENLDDKQRKLFDSENFKKGNDFDGKLGKSTLSYWKVVYDKVDVYVKAMEGKYLPSQDNLEGGSSDATVDASVGAGGVDGTDAARETTPAEPITLDGKPHLPMQGSSALASSVELSGWTFYSTAVAGAEAQGTVTETTESSRVGLEGYKEYYVKKGEDTYKIEVNDNRLFPIAEKLEGGQWKKVLIGDNAACIRCLKAEADKIPVQTPYTIGRNGENYGLISYNRGLTIEPMTIDGKWLAEEGSSTKLSDSLAFLNFTNFLISDESHIDGKELKGKYPDLRIENNQLQVRVRKKGDNKDKWYTVPDKFGLNGINEKTLSNFKKYNNHEDWNDKWSKKKGNDYERVTLAGEVLATAAQAGTPVQAETTGTPVQVETTGTPVQAETTGTPVQVETTGTPVQVETTDTQNQNKEISTNLRGISDDDFSTMERNLGNQMFIEKKDGKITYDLEKLKAYLGTLRGKSRSELKDNMAFISAVQIFLNEKNEGEQNKLKITGIFDELTKGKVEAFQEKYNESVQQRQGAITLETDGIPGKNTIVVMLDGKVVAETSASNPTTSPASNPGSRPKGGSSKPVERGSDSRDPENVTKYGFRWVNCPNKDSLGMGGKNVYMKKEEIARSSGKSKNYYCKTKSNPDVFMRVNTDTPYLKRMITYGNMTTYKDEVNVCKAGVDKFNESLKKVFSSYSTIPVAKFGNGSYFIEYNGNKVNLDKSQLLSKKNINEVLAYVDYKASNLVYGIS